MGDTGPCGPCSELHIDLTQNGDTQGALVNKDSSECIEIWNLVFVQFNAIPMVLSVRLPRSMWIRGWGLNEWLRPSSVQDFKNFGSFSNYDTDVFRPIFTELEIERPYIQIGRFLGREQLRRLIRRKSMCLSGDRRSQEQLFHCRWDSTRQHGSNYVLWQILRRAVRYGDLWDYGALFSLNWSMSW